MQATAARSLLPCMDEPAYKAVFEVSVEVRPDGLKPANMPSVLKVCALGCVLEVISTEVCSILLMGVIVLLSLPACADVDRLLSNPFVMVSVGGCCQAFWSAFDAAAEQQRRSHSAQHELPEHFLLQVPKATSSVAPVVSAGSLGRAGAVKHACVLRPGHPRRPHADRLPADAAHVDVPACHCGRAHGRRDETGAVQTWQL